MIFSHEKRRACRPPGGGLDAKIAFASAPPNSTPPLMRLPFLTASALALSLAASCASSGQYTDSHWSQHSVTPRISRFFLGYDAEDDGSYRDFQWRRKQDINLFLRRYFLNHNPNNPHQPPVKVAAKRPNHSLLPNPIRYIHLEGVLLGAAVGFPFPLDSILGTLEPGGIKEFGDGVGETFSPLGKVTTSVVGTWITPAVSGLTGGKPTKSYADKQD